MAGDKINNIGTLVRIKAEAIEASGVYLKESKLINTIVSEI